MIYAIEMASGDMIDIQSFMMIVSNKPQVILRLLSQQIGGFSCNVGITDIENC
jgi:hypothetical protein